jgi:LysM repeat protein
VLVVTVAAALLVALWVTAGPGEEAGASQKTVPRAVVVEPGDTLWSIASRALPGVDPRLAVDRIVRLNRLPETIVFPGQRLVLPAR